MPGLHPNIPDIELMPSASSHPLMFLSLFQFCIFANTLPLALSLEIILPNGTPTVLQNTQISLRWMSGDPQEFNLGVYWAKGEMPDVLPDYSDAPVNQVVTNFTRDQNVTMTFNHTVYTDVEDHIVMAWGVGPYNSLAYSHWFAVDGSNTTDTGIGGGIIPSSTGSSAPVSQSPASTATNEDPTATVAATKIASRAGAIVGGVLGSLAFLSISGLVLFMLRRRRSSAPFRAFWKYLPNENRGPLTPFPLESSRMSIHQKRETEAQEPVSEVSTGRDYLQADIARMREEILVLRLENQTRRMEAGSGSLPPPSYRSTPSYPSSDV
ncbi:hypothetical protein EV421DRAFT_1909052 [Armillaria borealis]|uniref:Uncharacterized protein n=1 Tax=Armillaria borealis TaxID=47425 RepID=A0AA39MID9_9AGAR|nr:hypothetical protein EV421DRAFT_1909052 [Armillaria borealis]